MSTPEKPGRAAEPVASAIGVAVLGLGNVGSEVVRIIEESAPDLAARIDDLIWMGGGVTSGNYITNINNGASGGLLGVVLPNGSPAWASTTRWANQSCSASTCSRSAKSWPCPALRQLQAPHPTRWAW